MLYKKLVLGKNFRWPKCLQGFFPPKETHYSCKHCREAHVNLSIMSLSDDMIRGHTELSDTSIKTIMKTQWGFCVPKHFSYFICNGDLGFLPWYDFQTVKISNENNQIYIDWVCFEKLYKTSLSHFAFYLYHTSSAHALSHGRKESKFLRNMIELKIGTEYIEWRARKAKSLSVAVHIDTEKFNPKGRFSW